MKIFIVERNQCGWDEYDSVVVKAKNAENAQKLAIELSTDFEENDVSVTEIHLDDVEQVVLDSFNAG